jgi:hypothetical protein
VSIPSLRTAAPLRSDHLFPPLLLLWFDHLRLPSAPDAEHRALSDCAFYAEPFIRFCHFPSLSSGGSAAISARPCPRSRQTPSLSGRGIRTFRISSETLAKLLHPEFAAYGFGLY